MNRTNLSPATTVACLVALTEAADRTEREFNLLDSKRADMRSRATAAGGARARDLRDTLRELNAAAQTAETAMRAARWALSEFCRVAAVEPDRDAAELAAHG